MIDIRERRRYPETYLTRLARKGAAELGQELLDLDAAWRATTTSAGSLRAKLKSSGKPTAEQRDELQRAKEPFQETESKLAELEARRRALSPTGFFPTDAVNIYRVERDELYLVGTSEVPAAAFHAGELLAELPLRYVAYSTSTKDCSRLRKGLFGAPRRMGSGSAGA